MLRGTCIPKKIISIKNINKKSVNIFFVNKIKKIDKNTIKYVITNLKGSEVWKRKRIIK